MSRAVLFRRISGETPFSIVTGAGRWVLTPNVDVGILANITALRANVVPAMAYQTLGYYSIGDFGGGIFLYVSTDTTSTDNGSTIIVDALGHRYYLQTNGSEYNPVMFGAIGNGGSHPLSQFTSYLGVNVARWTLLQWQAIFPFATAISNEIDWCAFTAMTNFLKTVVDIFSPINGAGRIYIFDQPWAPPSNCVLFCGQITAVAGANWNAATGVVILGSQFNVGIRDFVIDCGLIPNVQGVYNNSTSGIHFDNL